MTSIAIIGGTGYSGGNIAREALKRGFGVTEVARHEPRSLLAGAVFQSGEISDDVLMRELAEDNDVLVIAIHAVDAENRPVLLPAMPAVTDAAREGGARLGVVGGAGSSLLSAEGPRLVDAPGFPEQFKPEALAHAEVLAWLRTSAPESLDWFYVSPANVYGSFAPGETTGSYRTDGDVVVTKEDGTSEISGTDFALAFVDEIAHPRHRRQRFTVGH